MLRLLTSRAIERAEGVGATIDVIALAAVRATREAMVRHDGETLAAIVGTPIEGERIGDDVFDGVAEGAIFPGELPADPRHVFRGDALALTGGRRRLPLPEVPSAGSPRSAATASRCRCRTSGSTGRWSSCSATVSAESAGSA